MLIRSAGEALRQLRQDSPTSRLLGTVAESNGAFRATRNGPSGKLRMQWCLDREAVALAAERRTEDAAVRKSPGEDGAARPTAQLEAEAIRPAASGGRLDGAGRWPKADVPFLG